MSLHQPPDQTVLKDATPAQLEQAAADNHRQLFCMNAISMGGDVQRTDGLMWTYTGPASGAMIPFPSLDEASAGMALDKMMAYYREHPPASAGCWSLDPPQPADLAAKLLARGFQPGWKPNWMALDLHAIKSDHASPAGLQVQPDNEVSTNEIKDLPYAGENGAVSNALMHAHPQRARRFIAILNGDIVGQSCVFLSTGEYGVAGIYNVGVVPEARQQGIGKAVVVAACLYAREHGYHYAVLNGTGRRMYLQVGFNWVGNGFTWWLVKKDYLIHPPTHNQVQMAEAVGKGDIAMLNNLVKHFSASDLNSRLANGMTLMQLAVCLQQRVAAEWLLEHGAKYSVLDAWDMGWKDRAALLLTTDPEQVNRLYNDGKITLLHIAAERNDITLARLVLSAKPDLEIKDKTYNATALGWSQHLKRQGIEELIKKSV